MAAKRRLKSAWLQSWGSVIGLTFERGGSVEVLMTWPEVDRILHAWEQHEAEKKRPDGKVLEALKLLQRRVSRLNGELIAEVPIARRRALIIPIVPEGSQDLNTVRQNVRSLRQRMLGFSFEGKGLR